MKNYQMLSSICALAITISVQTTKLNFPCIENLIMFSSCLWFNLVYAIFRIRFRYWLMIIRIFNSRCSVHFMLKMFVETLQSAKCSNGITNAFLLTGNTLAQQMKMEKRKRSEHYVHINNKYPLKFHFIYIIAYFVHVFHCVSRCE